MIPTSPTIDLSLLPAVPEYGGNAVLMALDGFRPPVVSLQSEMG